MHLLHHINLEVSTAVHLAHVARKDVSNTHMSIVCNIQLDPAVFQKFFFGGTLGQHSWPSRLNKAGSGDLNISVLRVICPDRARGFWIFNSSAARSACRSAARVGMSWAGPDGGSWVDESGTAISRTGSVTTVSSAGLLFLTRLLGLACPLRQNKG